jgi:hypothetical protein
MACGPNSEVSGARNGAIAAGIRRIINVQGF